MGLVAAPAIQAERPADGDIVCWIDDAGQRTCGDHVPPQYAKKQREIYNRRGVLVRTLGAERTPEQRAEDERRQREAQDAVLQQQNDTFLLQTYASVAELKAARDNRLQTFDLHIDLAEKALREGAGSLKDLQARADAQRDAGDDPDAELLGQIKSFQNAQADNARALAQIKQEREATAARFEADIRRYQELRGAAPGP